MSEERTGTVGVAGKTRLFVRSARAAEPRGRLMAVHGLGQHSGRLHHMGACAERLGLDYFALDLRGHGRSPGRRGHISSLDRVLSDIDRIRRRSGSAEVRLPTFLLGHSLGGLIVGRYIQEFGFPGLEGAILVSPFVDVALRPPAWKLRMADLADRLFPSLTLYDEVPPELLYRNASEIDEHRSDPLVHHRLSARLWGEMRRHARTLVDRAGQSRVPLFVQVSGDDRVVDAAAARELADAFAGDTKVAEYEAAYHDLYRDPLADRATSELEAWIERRLEVAGGAQANAVV